LKSTRADEEEGKDSKEKLLKNEFGFDDFCHKFSK
jgi:hypothetical protein